MHETELHEDAVPVNNRGTESRREEQRGDNRISNRELFEHHPQYPRKVSEEPLEPHELIHLVFVYAKGDYEPFSSFLELVKEILGTIENGDTVTYETHDSEFFQDNMMTMCMTFVKEQCLSYHFSLLPFAVIECFDVLPVKQ